MKITALAISALLGALGVADAKKVTKQDLQVLQRRAAEGKINKKSLMAGAKPHSPAAKRRMDDAQWEINGYYSVEFDACISLLTQNEDLFDEDMVYYASNGLVKSTASFITFTVCESYNCSNQSDDEKMTFITDIATYFGALVEYLPNQVKQYCEGCEDNEDYCNGNMEQEQNDEQEESEEEEESNEEEGEEGEEDGEDRRKLAGTRRRLNNQRVVEYIDCNLCEEYQCFEEEEENDRKLDEEEYDIDGAIEWIQELAECKELEDVVYNDAELYAGLMCNQQGNGVEIAIFMDDECTLYTTVESFQNVMTYADKTYQSMTYEMVEYTFTNAFNCENIEIEYTNPYAEQEDEEEEEEDDGEAPEAAEYCEDLFDETVNMYDCDMDGEEDEEANQDGDDYINNYEWYNYELTNDEAEDAGAVCKVLNGWDQEAGTSKSYQGKTVYDKEASGEMYNYQKNSGSSDVSGGGIAAIVIFVLIIVGVVGFFAFGKMKSKNDKKAPLINANDEGQMA